MSQVGTRPYEFPNRVHLAIAYELNLNLETLDRQVYSLLDLLGDIGGLSEALVFFGSLILFFLQYGQFDDFLTTSLYSARPKPKPSFLTTIKPPNSIPKS